jgi:AraC-like DNA-binding protein
VNEQYPARPQWRRVSLGRGHVLDLLHARVAQPFAPHVHEAFALGACTDGLEVISYRGGRHYAGPGSVVILEPGEPHTGGPAMGPGFVYRVMYPGASLLADDLLAGGVAGRGRLAGGSGWPRFPEPVVMDPELARGLRRVHAGLSQDSEPLEAESRLSWLLGELVRRHASPAPELDGPAGRLPAAGRLASQVMTRLADQLTCPPGLADLAAEAGLSRYQLLRSFRAEVGMPPYAWLAQHRVARARLLLDRGHRPAQAAALAGFADQAHLTRWFRRVVGVTPGAYAASVYPGPPPPA